MTRLVARPKVSRGARDRKLTRQDHEEKHPTVPNALSGEKTADDDGAADYEQHPFKPGKRGKDSS